MTKKRLSKNKVSKPRIGSGSTSGTENKPLMRAMQELRRSNAAQPHTPKPYKGTRGAKRRAAIDEQRRDV